jgi:hypothetical protein
MMRRPLTQNTICRFFVDNFKPFFRADLFDEPAELTEIKTLKLDPTILEITDEDRLQMKDLKIK